VIFVFIGVFVTPAVVFIENMSGACGEDGLEDIEDLISAENPKTKTKRGSKPQPNGVTAVCL